MAGASLEAQPTSRHAGLPGTCVHHLAVRPGRLQVPLAGCCLRPYATGEPQCCCRQPTATARSAVSLLVGGHATERPAHSLLVSGQPRYLVSFRAMGMAMAQAMMMSRMRAQHIHLRVFFCSRLAATRWVVPACTYSTLLATCRRWG